jgi:hypothetical protein
MSFKRVKTTSGPPMIRPNVWPILLLVLAATIFWQCEEKTTGPVYIPVPSVQFIDSVFPADGAVNVPVGSCIRITFLRPMDTATVVAKKFHFSGNHIYSLSRDSMHVIFCAAGGLNHAAEYQVVIDSGLADTLGNVMTSPYSFSFRTESGNALISSVSPANGDTAVRLDAEITVAFAREMDTSTLNTATVLMSDGIDGAISYANHRLIFTPADSLESYHTYTMTLKAAIADTAGTTLGQDYTWSFTTFRTGTMYIKSVYPLDGATEVPVNTDIYVQFSVGIDPASVTPADFTVSNGVTGTVSVVGSYISSIHFTPSADLQQNTTYTAAFRGDVTSTTGQLMHVNRSWTFTTADTFPPQVVSVFPADGDPNVSPKANIFITFNKNIDPASITAGELYIVNHPNGGDQTSVSGATVTLNPYYDLPNAEQVTAVFDGDVSDRNGYGAHIDYTWQFTTNPVFKLVTIDPDTNEACVPTNTIIRMVFSRPLDAATVTAVNFIFGEFGGSQLSGALATYDSIVEFQPDIPLSQLKKYQMKVLTGVRDIYGDNLSVSRTWQFTTKGENLLPLAIGNRWIYQTDAAVDSIVLMGDTIISGKLYYFDQNKRTYRYENDTLEFSMYGFPLFGDPHVFVNSDCVNRLAMVTTVNGTFLCQRFQGQIFFGPVVTQQFDFAPGVGLVRFFEDYWSGGSGDPHQLRTWTLISYELH